MVGVVPVVGVLEPHTRQVRSDASGGEEMGEVEGVLAGLGDRSPPELLAGDRPHVLAVAVPAPLADIHGAPELLEWRVIARLVPHPLDFPEGRSHRAADSLRAGLGQDGGEKPLTDNPHGPEPESPPDPEGLVPPHGASTPPTPTAGRGGP